MGYLMSIYSDNDGAFLSVVKKFFGDEGIQYIVAQTHANVAERFIRTIKNMIHNRVRFNKSGWTSMLLTVLKKYNSTQHSPTKMSPNQAHEDDNNLIVRVNLMLREKTEESIQKLKKVIRSNSSERKEATTLTEGI